MLAICPGICSDGTIYLVVPPVALSVFTSSGRGAGLSRPGLAVARLFLRRRGLVQTSVEFVTKSAGCATGSRVDRVP